MANILLTEKCVRACPYCFARKHMDNAPAEDGLSWENLIYAVNLLEAAGEKHAALLGGEPTIHREFVDFVLYLAARQFHVNIFTSAIVSQSTLGEMDKHFADIRPGALSFVVNLNHPDLSTAAQLDRIDAFLRVFGPLSTPGFNIYEPDFDLTFIFEAVNRYGMHRHVRLGLAHPIPGAVNAFVAKEDMAKTMQRLLSFLPVFERLNITPGFDCGFPLCMFTDDELGRLFKACRGNIKFGCGPAIDIGPDLNVWACFPLANVQKKSLYDFTDFNSIREFYAKVHGRIRIEAGGIFEQCDSCRFREQHLCEGGCLAHIIRELPAERLERIAEVGA
jgi:radical SAM protein with 4Fe4S-binding SPASM domain